MSELIEKLLKCRCSINVYRQIIYVKSIVLSAWNVKMHGSRLYAPIYAAGRLGRLLLHARKVLE